MDDIEVGKVKGYLKERGLSGAQVSEQTGLTRNYVYGLLNGSDYFSPAARARFLVAYPALVEILFPAGGESMEKA